jgi:hypothetical protein
MRERKNAARIMIMVEVGTHAELGQTLLIGATKKLMMSSMKLKF